MGSLTYSSSALNTLSKFHRNPFVVYVEGNDDVKFWSKVFCILGFRTPKLKVAGGSAEIVKYASQIVNDGSKIGVARDRDFADFLNSIIDHPQVIYTYGYSIENTLYNANSILKVLTAYAEIDRDLEIESIRLWLDEFVEMSRILVECEIVSLENGLGIAILGDNCSRFLKSSNSAELDPSKIECMINQHPNLFPEAMVANVTSRIAVLGKPLTQIIRGHFLSNGVLNYVRSRIRSIAGKNITISRESFFAGFILCFSRDDLNSAESTYYSGCFSSFEAALVDG